MPIAEALPRLSKALATHQNLVLQAPPGAGKTTSVPLHLLDEAWCARKRIIMLEPRRLAARAAAMRMAEMLQEDVGETVGYRVRLDSKIGPKTRIEIVTEGILTRMLQDDPALEGVVAVVFDEFHERHLHSDAGLAFCLDIQENLRDDLRIIVMSATLDAQPIAVHLGNAPIVTSEGRSFPVDIRYIDADSTEPIEQSVTRTIVQAIRECGGDVLVFLPGVREIQRVETQLQTLTADLDLRIAPLYGDLNKSQQDAAIRPSKDGRRRIVLATNIAESSLTIEGVAIVVDSGLARRARFEPNTGMSRLETTKISQASAAQRAGRAGRQGPGVCYRLWSRDAHTRLIPFNSPEIEESDLAPLALDLAQWGIVDPFHMRWLTPPPAATLNQARDLLGLLLALDDKGKITSHGLAMNRLGFHPRLSHMMIRGKELGEGYHACEIAGILSERDIMRGRTANKDCDLHTRIALWRSVVAKPDGAKNTRDPAVDRSACFQIKNQVDSWARQLGVRADHRPAEFTGILVALAYPERIAKRRGGNEPNFIMANGRGARFWNIEPLAQEVMIAIAQLDAGDREARIHLAAALDIDAFNQHFSNQITLVERVEWNSRSQSVHAKRIWRYGELVLREQPLQEISAQVRARALVQGIREIGLNGLQWPEDVLEWRARVNLLRRAEHRLRDEDAEWPDVGDEALLRNLDQWLEPHLLACLQIRDIDGDLLRQALIGLLTWRQQQALDGLAPTHLQVASGSRIRLDYRSQDRPVLAVRLQEMFGEEATPLIADGRIPVILHLLSPAMRVAQITEDLAGFWKNSYADVKKDLKARYPKHVWPDDPAHAIPTTRAKPRKHD